MAVVNFDIYTATALAALRTPPFPYHGGCHFLGGTSMFIEHVLNSSCLPSSIQPSKFKSGTRGGRRQMLVFGLSNPAILVSFSRLEVPKVSHKWKWMHSFGLSMCLKFVSLVFCYHLLTGISSGKGSYPCLD